ncbi:hypothetical protein SAMN04487776_11915 [Priestia megaterium]|nr:hypothetical protein SAMN04487776_11915 [Priestia megaterium]
MSLFQVTRETTHYLFEHLLCGNYAEATMGEETMTDLLAVDLKIRILFTALKGLDTKIVQCDKHKEKETGADFLWYIHSKKSGKYIGLYVQAKRSIDSYNSSKDSLGRCKLSHNYKNPIPVGSGRSAAVITRQVDNLIHQAEIAKAIPLYCFYNFLDTDTLSSPNSDYLTKRKFPSSLLWPDEFSFTYAHAKHVQELLNKKRGTNATQNRNTFKFKEIMGFPFYTLFAKLTRLDNSTNITQRIYRNAMLTYDSLSDPKVMVDKNPNDYNKEDKYILDKLPDHIQALFDGNSINDKSTRNKNLNKEPLPSYVILTSTDEDITDETLNQLFNG